MAEPLAPPNVKLICGMISSQVDLFEKALAPLAEAFGAVDLVSEVMDFDFTHYYDAQMGSPLYRRFVAFQKLTSPETLIEAKLTTHAIERDFAASAGGAVARPINLDPGYVEPSKLVLASMKNFSHRIYLGRGVYGDLTLMMHKGAWKAMDWTFPDYASGRYFSFLDEVRRLARLAGAREAST